MMEREQLRTVSTVEAVSTALEEDIYALRYEMGEKIKETDLVLRFNVSRNTIREALAYLTSKGLLEKVTNKGIYVKEIMAADIVEIFHLRQLLEAEAIREIIASGEFPQRLHALTAAVSERDPEKERIANLNADMAFHEGLVEAAGSQRLTKMYQGLLTEVKLCVFQSQAFVPARSENIVRHFDLLRAMEAGDLKEALNCLSEHIESAIQCYQNGLRQRVRTK